MNRSKPPARPRDGKVKEQEESYSLIEERYEIIGGVRYDFLSSPKYAHQKMLTNFYLAFHSACSQEGEILLAPMDVHFDENNIVQPDVIYIASERLDMIHDGFVFGVPDLLVEILSESTGRHDKKVKKALYEQFGVKEYWLADPIYRTVDQFVLQEGRYELAATLSEGDTLTSPTVPCLAIDLSAIFPENLRQ
ncbi:Uma2 family endonuclease [Cohnella cellulosilytica]|uniref:Uma2 family endonuclease n=1 Tax=Cohnella cellulosilytica TaxID=986710 RepID=A0ABW2F6J9_9BACL